MGVMSGCVDPSGNRHRHSGFGETQMRSFDCRAVQYNTAECQNHVCRALEESRSLWCSLPERIMGNPGGGTCLERDTDKKLAKQYCAEGDRMRTSPACTRTNLVNYYDELAEAYCKTSVGKADQWCSCYNVLNKVCDTDSNAAGCVDKELHFDSLVNATPDEFKSAWAGREGCFGGVCVGDKYIVPNANQGCDAPIQICKQDIQASNITQSMIDASCKIEGKPVETSEPVETGETGEPVETGENVSSGFVLDKIQMILIGIIILILIFK